MKKKENHKNKRSKSAIKKIAATAVLAGSLLIPTPAAANVADVKPKGETIQGRVKAVREALVKKLSDSRDNEAKLSYSERELSQGWGNWGNWANWANWANWNNWNNWGNWGNWRNF
jgi:hypothetical protein